MKPIFRDIPNFYLIGKDLIIATESIGEYLEAIREVKEVIKSKDLSLNLNKCSFNSKEIYFWIMLSSKEVKSDLEKVKDLANIQSPNNKEELKLLICMA